MNCKQCKKCGARWFRSEEGAEWQHYWSTGAVGNEADLAGLVCNNLADDQCINPKRGDVTGDTWKDRDEFAAKQKEKWDAEGRGETPEQ
jgi:hypothetical protein